MCTVQINIIDVNNKTWNSFVVTFDSLICLIAGDLPTSTLHRDDNISHQSLLLGKKVLAPQIETVCALISFPKVINITNMHEFCH